MSIHTLLSGFVALGYARVGRGPAHPIEPDRSSEASIATFFDQYPVLLQDASYAAFINAYAGASIAHPDNSLLVDIYGFTQASSHLIELPGTVIDPEGFLMFAGVYWRDTAVQSDALVEMDYAFDATGSRPQGVYGQRYGQGRYQWQYATFAEWLTALIDQKGRL